MTNTHRHTEWLKNYTRSRTARSHCGVKALLIKWLLGYMSSRHSRWRGIPVCDYHLSMSLGASGWHPPVLDGVRSLLTYGAPCLCVCTHRWACGGVVKRRSSLSTDQVALINPLKGGSLQKVKHLNSTSTAAPFFFFFFTPHLIDLAIGKFRTDPHFATSSHFQRCLTFHSVVFFFELFLTFSLGWQVTFSHTHTLCACSSPLGLALQSWACSRPFIPVLTFDKRQPPLGIRLRTR